MGLSKLAEEDPTFKVETDQESGQTTIAGMGELHLEILVDRLKREYKVDANVGAPQVAPALFTRMSMGPTSSWIFWMSGSMLAKSLTSLAYT